MSLVNGEVCHRDQFSQHQTNPASIFFRAMAFCRIWSSLHFGPFPSSLQHGCLPSSLHQGAVFGSLQPDHFSTRALSGLQRFTTGQREIAVLTCLPNLLLIALGDCMVGDCMVASPSILPHPKQKSAPKANKQKSLWKQVSPLKLVYSQRH